MQTKGVAALLAPRNVVLVGASDRPGHWSKRVWGNLARFGFAGKVFPVNPGRSEIWGAPCYPDLASLPEPPDHLALFVPADVTIDEIEKGARLGARSATIFAAGFGEGGDPAGRKRAARLTALVSETGIAAAGPNCIGLASGPAKFVTMADELLAELRPGPIAVATQSGMLATGIHRTLTDRGLDVAHLVSAGNQTCLTFADYIDFFAGDPDVRAILCYIEFVLDRDRFLAAAAKARANGKTVVAVKIGGSEASRKAALAHTGNLAGSLAVFDAYAREAGIVRVACLEEMIEAAEYLAHAPRPAGPNVAFITNSGALKSLITETSEAYGLKLAHLSDETRAGMLSVLDDSFSPANPFDTRNTLATGKYMGCIRALAEAPEVDLVVTIEELPGEAGIARKVSNLNSLQAYAGEPADGRAPVAILSPMHFHDTDYMRELRATLPGLPCMRGLGASIRTLAGLARTPSRPVPAPAAEVDQDLRVQLFDCAHQIEQATPLSEVVSKEIVAAFGIPLPREIVASGADDAARAANEIGYPVVLKAIAADVPHKSDAGLVMLGLPDAAAVRDAARTIVQRTDAMGARLRGILVAEHVSGGVEAVVGIHRDPEMGLAIMVGMGGILLELIEDVAILTPAIDRDRALNAIARTRLGRLLSGYRGSAPRDISALADAVVAMGRLAVTFGDALESVDVNPLLVRDEGSGVVALDALVVLRPFRN
ncbi:MAG: hypothetical protein RLZ98_2670 [Pseudomonadota bacterium]|jgi:acetyltransferase